MRVRDTALARARRWRRAAIVLAGVVAMLLLWIGGMALAIASFFLRC